MDRASWFDSPNPKFPVYFLPQPSKWPAIPHRKFLTTIRVLLIELKHNFDSYKLLQCIKFKYTL